MFQRQLTDNVETLQQVHAIATRKRGGKRKSMAKKSSRKISKTKFCRVFISEPESTPETTITTKDTVQTQTTIGFEVEAEANNPETQTITELTTVIEPELATQTTPEPTTAVEPELATQTTQEPTTTVEDTVQTKTTTEFEVETQADNVETQTTTEPTIAV